MEIIGIFKKSFLLGLDIGSSSIKLVQLEKKEDGLYLVKAEVKELGDKIGEEPRGDTLKHDERIVSALKDMTRGINIKKCNVAVSINCPKTSIKVMTAPYMPKSELAKGINLEAKNYFPFSIENSSLDYEILGDVVKKGARKYEILVTVSPKMTIERYVSILGKVGIRPISLIPCSRLLERIGDLLYRQKNEATCIIDIGELYTELVIFKEGNLIFTRKIPVSGEDFTKAMTGVLVSDRGKTSLTLDEAEKIKQEIGIPSEADSRIIDDKISTNQILAMLRTPVERLIEEIGRCFDYYGEEFGDTKIGSVVLFGGGSFLSGLIKVLSQELGVEVRLGDALEGLSIEKDALDLKERDKISHKLELALAAALNGPKGVNLLPLEMKEAAKRLFARATIQAIATAVIISSILLYIGMNIQLTNFKKRISVAKLELSSLQYQFKKAEAHHLANIVLVDEPHWEDIFKELCHLIPEDIHLTEMTLEEGVITMKGFVTAKDGGQLLSGFIVALKNGIFEDVRLVETKELEGRVGSEFILKCRPE